MGSRKVIHFSPARTILTSILATIIIGTILLSLPLARTVPIPFLDLFFTATSSTCVTGLFTISLENFTFFGQCIILALIQIGGIGLITLTVFLMSLFVNLGLATQLMTGQILDIDRWKHVKRIVLFIVLTTAITELIGSFFIFLSIKNNFPFGRALFLSLFHSIASFCSAGITLIPGGIKQFNQNYLFLITTILLIFIGTLGFLTWNELFTYWQARQRKERYRISLTTKIIFYATLFITGTIALLILLFEHNAAFSTTNKPLLLILNILLQSLSLRGVGFLMANLWQFKLVTLFLAMIVSFIGFSPGSTGSGVKITTFIVFLAIVRAAITGRTSVEINGRTIPTDQLYKATAIIALGISWIAFTTFILLITETYTGFFPLLFEALSAFATLGISLGVTSTLSTVGKIIIIASMIIGRIGSLTLILALRKRKLERKAKAEFSYPEERITLS